MKPAVRSAEATRVSSCAFADEVARLSLFAFRELCPDELRESYKQTVVAAFLVHNEATNTPPALSVPLKVASLGVGTKFLSWSLINEESVSSPRRRCRMKDCHAEVLARRGFIVYLLNQCHIALSSVQHGTAESKVVILQPDGLFSLRSGVEIHLYSSSQPCGNASIKKWAKGKKPPVYPALPISKYPEETHGRLQVTARADGQVALLLKRSVREGTVGMKNGHEHVVGEIAASSCCDPGPLIEAVTDTAVTGGGACPPGTAAIESCCGAIMTCSDKIAKWNALGVQGGMLAAIFDRPIYISTCTIGRKYSKAHLERALCCRLQDFAFPNSTKRSGKTKGELLVTVPGSDERNNVISIYTTHHPVMLSTGVKVDDGAIATAATEGMAGGARFEQPLCLVWADTLHAKPVKSGEEPPLKVGSCSHCDAADVIDSRFGLRVKWDESVASSSLDAGAGLLDISRFCGMSVFESFVELVKGYSSYVGDARCQLSNVNVSPLLELDAAMRTRAVSSLAQAPVDQACIVGAKRVDSSVDSAIEDILLVNNTKSLILGELYVAFKQCVSSLPATSSDCVHQHQLSLYARAKEQLMSDPMMFKGWVSNPGV